MIAIENLFFRTDSATLEDEYWRRSALQLDGAYAVVQQAVEFSLKGRIAAFSPLLLIDLGSRSDRDDTETRTRSKVPRSFDSFRSMSAFDLVRLYNTVADEPLSDASVSLWEDLRKRRNIVMHSVTKKPSVSISELVCAILGSYRLYHSQKAWTVVRLEAHDDDIKNDLGVWQLSMAHSTVSNELRLVERVVASADLRRYFSFHSGRRYLCPACHNSTDHHYANDLPHFAQLIQRRDPGCTSLACRVCEVVSEVTRSKCDKPGCNSNVLSPELGVCLTCLE